MTTNLAHPPLQMPSAARNNKPTNPLKQPRMDYGIGRAELEPGSQWADWAAPWFHQEMDSPHSWRLLQGIAGCLALLVSKSGSISRPQTHSQRQWLKEPLLQNKIFLRSSQTNLFSQYWVELGQDPTPKPATVRRTDSDHSGFTPWNWGGNNVYLSPVRMGMGRGGEEDPWPNQSPARGTHGGRDGGRPSTPCSELQATSPSRICSLNQVFHPFRGEKKLFWQSSDDLGICECS